MSEQVNGTDKQAAKRDKRALTVEQKLELSHMLRQEQD